MRALLETRPGHQLNQRSSEVAVQLCQLVDSCLRADGAVDKRRTILTQAELAARLALAAAPEALRGVQHGQLVWVDTTEKPTDAATLVQQHGHLLPYLKEGLLNGSIPVIHLTPVPLAFGAEEMILESATGESQIVHLPKLTRKPRRLPTAIYRVTPETHTLFVQTGTNPDGQPILQEHTVTLLHLERVWTLPNTPNPRHKFLWLRTVSSYRYDTS